MNKIGLVLALVVCGCGKSAGTPESSDAAAASGDAAGTAADGAQALDAEPAADASVGTGDDAGTGMDAEPAGFDAATCSVDTDCTAGLHCCGTRCTNTPNDPTNCGACFHVCSSPTVYCGAGTCQVPPCATTCSSGVCCGSVCCGTGQVCCGVGGGGPAMKLFCHTVTESTPTCPASCTNCS
jgi:hypothetical protein